MSDIYHSYELDTDSVAGSSQRHWSPESQYFATCDALLTALDRGWSVSGIIFRQEFWHGGSRIVPVYHVPLRRGEKQQKMVIIETPYLMRLVNTFGVQVVRINQRKDSVDGRG